MREQATTHSSFRWHLLSFQIEVYCSMPIKEHFCVKKVYLFYLILECFTQGCPEDFSSPVKLQRLTP